MVARIDWTAVATAAAAGLAIILPGAALSGLVADRGGWVVWLFLAVVAAGFGVAGLVAGRLRNDTPMLHGAIGAMVAFVIAATIGLVTAAVRDRSISVIAVPLAALTAVTAGVCGALLADLLHRKTGRQRPVGG